jgi:hypothetical protein
MLQIRWWLFKRLSDLGWWICPEPHYSNLKGMWDLKIKVAEGPVGFATKAEIDAAKSVIK